MTVTDCVEMGIEAAANRALEVAWEGADAVWLSFDVDCLDAAFVAGTGWPEPGGFLPREVLSSSNWWRSGRWPGSRSSSARRPMTTRRSPR
jgi:arginase family enzyme